MEARRKYSIIYPEFDGVEYKQLSENAFHDLALDTLCKNITDNNKESKMIYDVISNMTADVRVAEFRQEIFSDILRLPDFRKRMTELFDKFEFMPPVPLRSMILSKSYSISIRILRTRIYEISRKNGTQNFENFT
jgi:hypothetical protein